ncbi:hypothetical protein BUALT_Bualt02G0025300 [Buddleja alternifolia]|uniref:Pollen Ole e 1 allergen and extensin family protein n=1 Tax=Buddleja alternifolia TaxID=168488 RepID=A0AAV6Y3B5_9LAMI|nr:hypothetical protein BUALT_Bualt02G0025300 [Buddleja alternifolia]
MATRKVLIALFFFFFTLALANAEIRKVLKGSVICGFDCNHSSDLSGIQVLVKCDKVKKLAVTYTEEDGSFVTGLPSDSDELKSTNNPINCMAKIMGGPYQLYISSKNSITPIVEAKESSHFTTAKPLKFYKSCPLEGKCGGKDKGFASSKTVDLPLPREWGLAPSSYYIPFIPIIGIP